MSASCRPQSCTRMPQRVENASIPFSSLLVEREPALLPADLGSTQGFVLIERLLPLSIVLLLIIAISLLTIFFFKNRRVQIWLSALLIGLVSFLILACGHGSYLIMTRYSAEIVLGIKIALPFLMLIFSILAYRAIRKDDNMVKSYDRLR